MSIGNLKTDGGKGTNWPWQYKMLLGLDKIVATIKTDGKDYESDLISIKCGANPAVIRLEVRIFDTTTGSFTTIQLYPPGSLTEDTTDYSACTKTYLEAGDATELTLQAVLDELEAIQTGTAAALGQTTKANSVPVVIASDQTGAIRTPTMERAVVGGTIVAGAYSVSFANVGTATATVLTADLEPGETVSFDAGAINNTLGEITYTASATGILLIIKIT